MTITPTEIVTAEDLLAMPDDVFRTLVEQDIRSDAPDNQASALRSQAVANRWYSTLVSIKISVEGQLGARQEDMLALPPPVDPRKIREYHAWRGKTLRFKTGLDERVVEAKYLRQVADSTKLWTLQRAIRAHQHHICTALCDDAGCPADQALWSLVQGD